MPAVHSKTTDSYDVENMYANVQRAHPADDSNTLFMRMVKAVFDGVDAKKISQKFVFKVDPQQKKMLSIFMYHPQENNLQNPKARGVEARLDVEDDISRLIYYAYTKTVAFKSA